VSWEDELTTVRTAIEATAGTPLIQTTYGKAPTVKGLSNLISDAAKAAGIQGRSAQLSEDWRPHQKQDNRAFSSGCGVKWARWRRREINDLQVSV